jgi:GT2 family glycosyltransferase/glycosyltransferase involved in cell wall biosynthesis
MAPKVSVIMPIHNGLSTLNRAIASVLTQDLPDWELLAIDDSSNDGSLEFVQAASRRDCRIRVLRTDENLGPSHARNIGLKAALGNMITYLDCDDEYYPNYLSHTDHFGKKGDVIVSCYDYMCDDDDTKTIQGTWNPRRMRDFLFMVNCSTPLGIAHRRELCERTGGFDESLWCLEDWELWKKLARSGAEFLYVPLRSGVYHIRVESRSRAPRTTASQSAFLNMNHAQGLPLYGRTPQTHEHAVGKILLACLQCVLDDSPASRSVLSTLELLVSEGFECHVVCSDLRSSKRVAPIEQTLRERDLPFTARPSDLGPFSAHVTYTRLGRIPITVICSAAKEPDRPRLIEPQAFLGFFERTLGAIRPDVLLTHGHDWVTDGMISLAKRRDMTVVFEIHSLEYRHPKLFSNVDHCVVPTDFARDYYWKNMGLHGHLLPHAFGWEACHKSPRRALFLMMFASSSEGDVLWSAKLEEILTRTRPDIPVVLLGPDRRRQRRSVDQAPPSVNNRDCPERRWTPDQIYSSARVVMIPGLSPGVYDRDAAEALMNGIPLLVGNRGALPEIVGDAGFVIDIKPSYGAHSIHEPMADDVSDWVAMVTRLWDDEQLYAEASTNCLNYSERWHPRETAPVYASFFRNLRRQPGPPLIPKCFEKGAHRQQAGQG